MREQTGREGGGADPFPTVYFSALQYRLSVLQAMCSPLLFFLIENLSIERRIECQDYYLPFFPLRYVYMYPEIGSWGVLWGKDAAQELTQLPVLTTKNLQCFSLGEVQVSWTYDLIYGAKVLVFTVFYLFWYNEEILQNRFLLKDMI
jgi:hypothetical protein